MNTSPAPVASSRSLKTLAVLTRLLLWLVLAAWALFALTWGALQLWIVPRIGEWRPDLERWATSAVGVPVKVGEIVAAPRASGAGPLPSFMPAFELRDVRLYDAQGRVALQLPLVRTAVSVGSLWRLSFEQLVIDRPSLDVRRTRDGQWRVAGLDLSAAQASDQTALGDWFFSQTEFVIRDGQLRWQDESLSQPPLELSNVDLVVRNPARRHLMRLDATPPPEWGERFSLRGDFRQPFSLLPQTRHWQAWNGTLFAEFGRVDLQRLRQQVSVAEAAALQVHQGHGALRLWADLQRGSLTSLTADTALERVALQLGPTLPTLDVPALSGRLQARWRADGWEVGTDNLLLQTQAGTPWSLGRLSVSHQLPRRGTEASTELQAERIDLDAVREVAEHLPLPQALRREIGVAQPQGLISQLQLQWSGLPWASQEMPSRWRAKGRVDGLAVAPGRVPADAPVGTLGRPGIEGAGMDFDIGPEQGTLQLGISEGALTWPGLFEQPRVVVDRLQGPLSWRLDGERIELKLPQLRFANADAAGELQLSWHTGEGSARQPRWPGVLDLSAKLDRANGAQVHRYLPLEIAADARRYVREAVLRGEAQNTRFRVKGDLHRFPFAKAADGEFRISAQMSGVDFDYVPPSVAVPGAPPWPGLRGLQGQFVIDGESMRLADVRGSLAGGPGVRIQKADARLDNYTRLGTVAVTLRASGVADELLGFVNRSPLAEMTGQALAQARLGGSAELQLKLGLPVQRTATGRALMRHLMKRQVR